MAKKKKRKKKRTKAFSGPLGGVQTNQGPRGTVAHDGIRNNTLSSQQTDPQEYPPAAGEISGADVVAAPNSVMAAGAPLIEESDLASCCSPKLSGTPASNAELATEPQSAPAGNAGVTAEDQQQAPSGKIGTASEDQPQAALLRAGQQEVVKAPASRNLEESPAAVVSTAKLTEPSGRETTKLWQILTSAGCCNRQYFHYLCQIKPRLVTCLALAALLLIFMLGFYLLWLQISFIHSRQGIIAAGLTKQYQTYQKQYK